MTLVFVVFKDLNVVLEGWSCVDEGTTPLIYHYIGEKRYIRSMIVTQNLKIHR